MERQRSTQPEFENEYCKFKPFDWQEVDGILRPIIFKVVTEDLKSLGLKRNPKVRDPNILTFPIGQWVMEPDEKLLPTNEHWGGIWGTFILSEARGLMKYMLEAHNTPTRNFIAAVDTPIYANNRRVKSRGIILLEEV